MAFAITAVQAYGIEAEEPVNTVKSYRQYLVLTITAANTDVDWDFGDNQTGSLGTFWDAVDGTTIGANALKVIQDIVTRAKSFSNLGGSIAAYALQSAGTANAVTKLDSDASAGGNATETMVVTGLLTTDVLLGVTQFVDGAGAAVGILAYGGATGVCSTNDQLSVTWNADPGAGAKIRVAVLRAAATPATGGYTIVMANKTPNLLFTTTNAPTTATVVLSWVLNDQTPPVEYKAVA